jgi:hypothetical protein
MSRLRTATLAVLAMLIIPLVAVAQSNDPFNLSWHTISSGGGRAAGGNFVLSGSVGQAAVSASSNASFVVRGGLWPALRAVGPSLTPTPTTPTQPGHWVYLPVVLK